MPFEYQQSEISLSDIDSEIETFRITTNSRVEDLASAMDLACLTNPPIVKPAANGYVVVCGFRRIAAARSLDWSAIPARILSEDAAPLSCALLAISENRIERSLNNIETSRALSLLSSLILKKEEFLETAQKVGLPGNPALIKKMLPLCSLPLPLQEGILSGALALPSAQMLSKLPDEIATAVADLLTTLKLSLHKQRELIDNVQEISIIEDCSIESILKSSNVSRILDDPKMDLPRKAGKIREYLRKRRFPHLSRAQDEFCGLTSLLKLGEHISLKPPPGFESNRYTISQSFGSLPEFEAQIKTLEQLAEKEEFVHLMRSRDPQCD